MKPENKDTKWKKIDEQQEQVDERAEELLPDDEDYPVSFNKKDWEIVTRI